MILDDSLEMADATSLGTPNGSTVNVGSTIDLNAAGVDVGTGEPMAVVVQITTAVASGGAASIRFKVVSDATATPSTDGTATEHGSTDTIGKATWVAGYQVVIPLAHFNPAYERYLGLQVQETASQALTAGAANAFLVPLSHVRSWKSYADASN